MTKTSALAISTLLLTACTAQVAQRPTSHESRVGMANPASVFCLQQGGQLRPVHTDQGTHALCVWPNGHAVEEWAYFRSHHAEPQ